MTPHPQGNGKPGDVAESERERFEAWARSIKLNMRRMQGFPDNYLSLGTHEAWLAWQARALLSPAPAQAQAPVEVSGPYKPVAEVIEAGHDDLEARIRWLFNPMPEGSTLYEQTSPPPQSAQLIEPEPNPVADEPQPAHNGHPVRHWDRTCPACLAELDSQSGQFKGKPQQWFTRAEVIALREPKAGSGLTEGKDAAREAIEAKAREIYDSWKDQPYWKPWVVGGNSSKQDHARRLAALSQGQQTEQGSRK